MDELSYYIPQFIIILGILVAVSNIITEVLKKVLPNNIPTSILALIISMLVTICTSSGIFSYYNITVTWYYIVSIIMIGFMVAYAAMFGFDKLKEIILSLGLNDNNKKQ